ncbi:ATP-binding cassette multidrug transporter pdr11 [Maudiozyma exigua]|uniref:ATP-binding cassette multidrug transporter pdr11 n=1 Tax=Maudiozyma exigua TaxID=34358 RepID=A0A9P7B479_MAUEX|nr:ATP-binding cassette multidrug transporter pdr11 [Kazachstania exigua]
MSNISKYFTPVPDASVTFNGANVELGNGFGRKVHSKDAEADVISAAAVEGSEENVLHDLTFRAEQGEMVLILGKPSSAFFNALFHGHKNLKYSPEGSIKFKENEYKAFSSKCPQQIIYNNEQDIHFPFLTVEQTIDFALSCKFDIPKEERIALRDELLKEFGLSHVLKTLVGNDYVRGVSGGERKRISIIETFAANGSVYLWDNSTKGLDSATALDFLSILQKMARATRSVNFVKISQASDKIVYKFDKILMLSDSYEVFYGTIDECMTYFRDSLGIEKDPNDCIIEYLTSILNFQFSTQNMKSHLIPRSEVDLYNLWKETDYYANCKKAVDEHGAPGSTNIPDEDVTPTFAISLTKQLDFVVRRAFDRSIGDKSYLISQFVSVVIQSLVIGSLFYDVAKTTIGSFSRGSLSFFAILFFTFLALSDLPAAFQRQSVVMKHVNLHFYYSWVETLASTCFDYTFKFILVVVFSIILYFLAHLKYEAARFFIFLLFLSFYNFSMVSLFTLTSLMSPTLSVANLIAGILLLAIAMYASYVIHLEDMHPWFIWIAYLNPAMFTMEAILSNELFTLKLDCSESIIPRGPAYVNVTFANKACAWQGATLGNNYVRGQDYLKSGLKYKYHHVWRNFGILIGFLCFYLFLSLFVAEYITPLYTRQNMLKVQAYLRAHGIISGSDIKFEEELYNEPIVTSSSSSSSLDSFHKENPEGSKDEDDKAPSSDSNNNTVQSQKHVISWKNINYTVEGNKQLINDVSGYISSGLTALMGESGAGKTTLLNVLSQRTEKGVVTGELLIDGQPLTNIAAFRRSIGFVQQQDVHLDLLTVKESLEVSCNLRGDGDMEYLASIAKLLRLPADKLVADLSPTDRKLLSIGVELVTKPSLLLFLDEPTSGLDSEAALTIVKFLKKLSEQGQAILCTIHQPSKSVISHFDNIFLLKRGGECVYFGDIESACDYFVDHDNLLTYDHETDNPADFIIDVVGGKVRDGESNMINWAKAWQESPQKSAIFDVLDNLEAEARNLNVDFTTSAWTQPSYMAQLRYIIKRQYICTKRDKIYVISKFGLNAGAGLFIGFSFWRTRHNISGLQNAIFLAFMNMCLSSPLINQVQDKALQSKDVFIARENRSNTYHWTVLLIAQTVVELPLAIGSSTLFFLCCYFCCGFSNAPHVAGVFYLNYILFSAYYLTFGLWLMYSAPDLQTAAVFVAFLYSFTASFCGVMQPYSLFPGFWTFMYRVSPYTYFIETFVSLLLHDRPVICDNSELVPGQPLMGQNCGEFMAPYIAEFGGYLKNPNTFTVCGYCTYTVGDDFLEVENMSYHHRWRNFGLEIVFVVFNFCAMFVGFYLTYIKNVWPGVYAWCMRVTGMNRLFKLNINPNGNYIDESPESTEKELQEKPDSFDASAESDEEPVAQSIEQPFINSVEVAPGSIQQSTTNAAASVSIEQPFATPLETPSIVQNEGNKL